MLEKNTDIYFEFENIRPDDFLPVSRKDLKKRGWDYLDVILITGDAYIDHPAFGVGVIARIIEHEGFRVGIIPQPNWKDDLRDFKKLGKPRLFFGITAGNMDSMVNHYTANKRLRSNDAYTPGNKAGFRPDYASKTYTEIVKRLFPDTPVILGGIEASMRRLTHYDYWSDQLQPGLLAQTPADILVYGMGEKAVIEICRLLDQGVPLDNVKKLNQIAYLRPKPSVRDEKSVYLASYEECLASKETFARNFKRTEEEFNKTDQAHVIQAIGDQEIVINPPFPAPTKKEIDHFYDLPYTRLPHPKYWKKPPIPAYDMIKFSVNIHRGCFGGCSFCTIAAHQGKHILSRSERSIIDELRDMSKRPDFKGHVSDLGGPSANMYEMNAKDPNVCRKCKRASCIYPEKCPNLDNNPEKLIALYQKARQIEGINKITIGSGIRYDLHYQLKTGSLINKTHEKYLEELVEHHVSGRLKVAPEHTADRVLKFVRKPSYQIFKKFRKFFIDKNRMSGKNQQLIPYFISSLPGCSNIDMAELAAETKADHFHLEQIQDFTPTPMTLSTVMYYTELDPYSGKKIYVPKSRHEKLGQRKYFFWYKKENQSDIKRDLVKQNRQDLIKKLLR